MIPIRDHNPTRHTPILIYALIVTNVLVFFYEYSLGPQAVEDFIRKFGVVPLILMENLETLSTPHVDTALILATPLTSMFLHGGFLHLIGNMWFLHVFGDNVEDKIGKLRFVVFYLLCGLGAAAGQIFVNPASDVPMIGASGAISGVLAGYMVLFPHARVLTLIPIFIFIRFMELPAFIFIFVWFGIQLLYGVLTLNLVSSQTGGTAWFAHIGGFVIGYILMKFVFKRRR